MAGKLSPRAQVKLAQLNEFAQHAQRVYALVEQYAADRTGGEVIGMTLRRALVQLKRGLMGSGYDSLAQLAGSMEIAASRGTNHNSKTRILREGVGSLKFQIELEQRTTVTEDARQQEKDEGT